MYAARIVEQGTADDVFLEPAHPYTIGLMRSVPRLDLPRGVKLETIEGLPPNLRAPPPGCRFAPRCPLRDRRMLRQRPLRWSRSTPAACSALHRAPGDRRRARWSRRGGASAARAPRPAADRRRRCSSVDDLKKYFDVKPAARLPVGRDRDRARGGRRSFDDHAGRDAGPGRRVRLRQDHGRPRAAAARRADRRRRSVSAAPTSRMPASRHARRAGARSR